MHRPDRGIGPSGRAIVERRRLDDHPWELAVAAGHRGRRCTPRAEPDRSAADRLDRPGWAPVLIDVPARVAGLRLLRLHPLSRRLPGDDRDGRQGDGRHGARSAGRLRDRRSATRHPGLAQDVRRLSQARIRRADRVLCADRDDGRGMGRPLRTDRDRDRGWLLDVAHGRRVPGRRRRGAPGDLPVRDRPGRDGGDPAQRSSPRPDPRRQGTLGRRQFRKRPAARRRHRSRPIPSRPSLRWMSGWSHRQSGPVRPVR